jgi:hypothetical protein
MASRGQDGKVNMVEGEAFVARVCADCGGCTLDYPSIDNPLCYSCCHATNPYAAKSLNFSIDVGPQDSTHPTRIANGTAEFNLALPGVVEEWGPRNAYGQRTVKKSRPIANSEIASSRRLKEFAKRANMTPQDTAKKAVPR